MRKYVISIICLLATAIICWAAVTTNIGVNLTISGLGNSTTSYSKSFSATTPDAVTQQYRVLAVANTAEAVALGDVSSVEGLVIACVSDSCSTTTGGLWVDCDYNSTAFDADMLIAEGEAAYFKPTGTVYVVGANSTETPIYEFTVLGTR